MPGPTDSQMLQVAVLGASGYVGGELLRLLRHHPAVGELRAFSSSHSGQMWSAVHPVFRNASDGQFEHLDVASAAHWGDVLFLALPHGRSQSIMPAIIAADPRLVVDTAADFRIHNSDLYTNSYGTHSAFELGADFIYGLADVLGQKLAGQKRIAAPGCFATATLLALWPLATQGLLADNPVCFAITGSTGSGTEPKPVTHHPSRAHNFLAYGLTGHRHEAEIAEQLMDWTGNTISGCSLLNHSAPLVRGIYATVHARLRGKVGDPNALLRDVYATTRFVRVLDQPPAITAVVGTNYAHLHGTPRSGCLEMIVTCAIDNLIKGAAGQAIQAANLALGLPESWGLEFAGLNFC